MAQQASDGLYIYRVSVTVGGDIVVRHVHGWNDTDALARLQARLTNEGHPLAAMSILDRKAIQ